MIGMLWFDNSNDTLEHKVRMAAKYYREKYGAAANLCYVHPAMTEQDIKIDDVQIRTTNQLMRNHFWLGVDSEN